MEGTDISPRVAFRAFANILCPVLLFYFEHKAKLLQFAPMCGQNEFCDVKGKIKKKREKAKINNSDEM